MARSHRRRALVLVVALAGCATPPPLPAARPPAQYDIPAVEPRDLSGGVAAAVGEQGSLGPIPVTEADPARGDALAPVTIVEFADFQSAFCQRAAETLVALQKEYGPAQLRLVWKNMPLPSHHDARSVAETAMAVFERGGSAGFWRYHDAIFLGQGALERRLFGAAITTAGFTEEDVARFVRSGTPGRKVVTDEQLAAQLGVTGAPMFFINGVGVPGAQPIEIFRKVIGEQLQVARAAADRGTPPARIYAELTTQSFIPPRAEPVPEPEPVDITVYRVPVGASPALGKATAPVTIVEFADFQCPYCVRAEETLKQVALRYHDKIRVVWKNVPLPFHKRSEPAAELASEALAQKGNAGFWRAHDLLLAQKGQLDDADLAAIARAAGLDVDSARRSVEKRRHRAAIEEDTDLADDVDAGGTPTFFINGRRLVGAQPLAAFTAIIDEQLAAAEAALARGVAPARLYETLQQGAKSASFDTATVPAPTAASPSRGPQGAKVVVQIWSDLECPFCKRVEPTLSALEAAFPGKLRVVWHNHPLPMHPHAMAAAEATLEAFAQKGSAGFWQMHDLILENQAGAGQERVELEQYAATVGLDLPRFRAALDGSVHRATIEADARVAEAAGLGATPGFVINGYRVSGAQPLARFKKVVRRALAEAK